MSVHGLIDTHCHLDYDYAPKSVEDLLREAGIAGVTQLVTIGTDPASLPKVAAISEKFPQVFHTVGYHPHEASTLKDADYETLRRAAGHPRCRAIGEIGLDYHYDHSPPKVQKAVLERQLELALETSLPVVVHSREAEPELLTALTRYARRLPAGAAPGIIHCFTGTRDFGRACIDLGFSISFSGILTFKNAQDLRDAAAEFPVERLLVETDSPYLAPVPFRGKKCEPSMIGATARKLAELKGMAFEELVSITSENARRVFSLPPT